MDKINKLYIPLIIFLSVVFNGIFKKYGIQTIYLPLLLMGIFFILYKAKKIKIENLYIAYFYIFSLTLVLIIQIFLYNNIISLLIKGYIIYSIYLLYWITYFHRYGLDDYYIFLKHTIPIVYLIGLLGIIQFFISPDLFGNISHSDSKNIEWAYNKNFSEYVQFFRASSTLGSPQVFGLFIAFYLIIVDNIAYFKNKINNTLGSVILFISGLLSGDKSFILIIFIYYLNKFLRNYKRKKYIFIALFLSLLIAINFNTLAKTRQIGRMINISKIKKQEENDSRIHKYINIILKSNILIGNGLGTRIFNSKTKQKATESYFLQILSECGIFVLSAFLLFLFISYILSNNFMGKILIILMSISMVIVHSFTSPTYFVFWGIIISSLCNRNKYDKKLFIGDKSFEYIN